MLVENLFPLTGTLVFEDNVAKQKEASFVTESSYIFFMSAIVAG